MRLLEEERVDKGRADRLWSGVRQDDGPALYFWLRLGYRPADAAESPWPGSAPHDMMAMVRKSENPIPAHEVGS